MTLIFLFVLLALLFCLYGYAKWHYHYFTRMKIPQLEPNFIFGNFQQAGRLHHSAMLDNVYQKCKGKAPVAGLYVFMRPTIMILDPQLLKSVLVKDFEFFHDRGIFVDEKNDPLSGHLFSLEGVKWKRLRAKLTPTFTSGKMKLMFETLLETATRFQDYLEDKSKNDEDLEIKDASSRFTSAVIGSVAFGIECNSFNVKENKMAKILSSIMGGSPLQMIKIIALHVMPKLGKFLKLKLTNPEVENFIRSIVKDIIEQRERDNIKRNDFMSLLIELKQKGDEEGITVDEICAQYLLFFVAGFDTSSSTMTFSLYELARNQDIQDRLRTEIGDVIAQHNGQITYESIMEMAYLDQVVSETLRIYPPEVALGRVSAQSYVFPGTDIVIPAGQHIVVPTFSIQRDAEFHPDPMKFDPDRFNPKRLKEMTPYTYLPFGEGPRSCIGMRFGLLQIKVGLVSILTKFRVLPTARTENEVEIAASATMLTPKNGMWLRLEKL